MGFTVSFPINTGVFVVINPEEADYKKPETLKGCLGSIACYNCVDEDQNNDDEFLVVVSGYKDAWCGEFLLSEIRVATEDEVLAYKKYMGINGE